MDGRFPGGLVLELFAAGEDAARDYARDRVPAMLAEWADASLLLRGAERDDRWLACYETERWDIEDFPASELHWERVRDARAGVEMLDAGLFRRCGPSLRPEASGFTSSQTGTEHVTGLVLGVVECVAAGSGAREELGSQRLEWDLNNWYNRHRMPAEIAAGNFATAYRFAEVVVRDGRRRFLHVLEYCGADLYGASRRQATERETMPTPPDGVDQPSETLFVVATNL
jgi:hypothetical protein